MNKQFNEQIKSTFLFAVDVNNWESLALLNKDPPCALCVLHLMENYIQYN